MGGKFARVSEQDGGHPYDVGSVARLTLDGVGDPSFAPVVSKDQAGLDNATVFALALSADGSVLYLGGKFSYVNGVAHKNLAAVSTADGRLVPGFDPVVGSTVNTILPEAGGSRIFIGGAFKNVDSLPVTRLAALDAATGLPDPLWTPTADSTVRTLAYAADGGTIFVSGHFATVNGQPRQSVARLNPDGSLVDWQAQPGIIPTPMTCWDVTSSLSAVYLGCGAGPNFSAAFSLTTGSHRHEDLEARHPGNVEGVALSPDGTGLFVGGHFGTNHTTDPICGDTMELHGLSEQSTTDGEFQCWAPHLYPDHDNAKGAWTVLVDSQGHLGRAAGSRRSVSPTTHCPRTASRSRAWRASLSEPPGSVDPRSPAGSAKSALAPRSLVEGGCRRTIVPFQGGKGVAMPTSDRIPFWQ